MLRITLIKIQRVGAGERISSPLHVFYMQLREHLPARGAGLQAEGGRRVQEPDEDVRVQNPEPRRHARLQGQGAVSGDHGWVPGARLWLLSSAADNRRRRLQPGKCPIRGLLRDCENRL